MTNRGGPFKVFGFSTYLAESAKTGGKNLHLE
jgi:hypothetical protein